MRKLVSRPVHGVGIGLRQAHFSTLLSACPPDNLPWLEVLADNFMYEAALPLQALETICSRWPVAFHCIGMSLGSIDPLNYKYLTTLKKLVDRFEPAWVSDHLCWCSIHGQYVPDLLPLPYTYETVGHVAARIEQVQNFLGRRIAIENVSTYAQFVGAEMDEATFVSEVVKKADCLLLCDINNIYVSATNHQFCPEQYLKTLPKDRIVQYHLAGFEDRDTYLFDTHGAPVHDKVWQLYQRALSILGPRPTCIEWDTDIPPYPILEAQRYKAQHFYDNAQHTPQSVLGCVTTA